MFELFSPQKSLTVLQGKGPNRWDWALLPIVLAVIAVFAFAAMQMSRPFVVGEVLDISLSPSLFAVLPPAHHLAHVHGFGFPLLFSLVFCSDCGGSMRQPKTDDSDARYFAIGTDSRFSSDCDRPLLLCFLRMICWASNARRSFAIFTSQAWNMAFSLYQSMRNVPSELNEAARIFRLSSWQRFWRLSCHLRCRDCFGI